MFNSRFSLLHLLFSVCLWVYLLQLFSYQFLCFVLRPPVSSWHCLHAQLCCLVPVKCFVLSASHIHVLSCLYYPIGLFSSLPNDLPPFLLSTPPLGLHHSLRVCYTSDPALSLSAPKSTDRKFRCTSRLHGDLSTLVRRFRRLSRSSHSPYIRILATM